MTDWTGQSSPFSPLPSLLLIKASNFIISSTDSTHFFFFVTVRHSFIHSCSIPRRYYEEELCHSRWLDNVHCRQLRTSCDCLSRAAFLCSSTSLSTVFHSGLRNININSFSHSCEYNYSYSIVPYPYTSHLMY